MNEKKIAIIGAGELGKQILNLLNYSVEKYFCVGFFDDTFQKGDEINSIPVIDKIDNIEHYYKREFFDEIIIGIGYNHMKFRNYLYKRLCKNINFAKIITNNCIIDKSAKLSTGTIVYPGTIIDKQVKIDGNVLINLGCIISHNSEIGENTYMAPGVVVSGFVKIGRNCFIGSGTIIKDNIVIEDNVIIGAGSVVIRNVIKNSRIVGNPAKNI